MEKERKNPVQIDLAEKNEDSKEFQPDRIRGVKVEIGGRELNLIYTMRVQMQAEEELEIDFTQLQEKLGKGKRTTRTLVGMFRLMGNEGLRLAGEKPDLTDDWIIDHMLPGYTMSYRIAAMSAVTAGWFMENDNSYNEEQDVTLNEIRKKNESTESPAGS